MEKNKEMPLEALAIKPLKWSLEDGCEYAAQSVVGEYYIGRPANSWNLTMPNGNILSFDTLLATKDAAQADHDVSIGT